MESLDMRVEEVARSWSPLVLLDCNIVRVGGFLQYLNASETCILVIFSHAVFGSPLASQYRAVALWPMIAYTPCMYRYLKKLKIANSVSFIV